MPKKHLYKAAIILVLILILSAGLNYTSAEEAAQPILRQIVVGYWDIWRHSDGETWQYTGKPGDQKEHTFELEIPESLSDYQNVRYSIIATEIISESYYRLGGYQGTSFLDFYKNILVYLPQDYHKKGDKTVSLKLEGFYQEITKEWQDELVEGRRWYLPAVIEWYGDPRIPNEPECLPCKEAPSITNTWEELYEWTVHHSDTCTGIDINGKEYEYDCFWTEYKSEIATYQETLSAGISVNTKQGIKDGGRESRASWEIIPDTKSRTPLYKKRDISIYGKNPNEVTRAGYGFEVKVTTEYNTDWETLVPSGASPKGGSYGGPQKVTANFYNSKGKYQGSLDLEATSGKPGDSHIIWELPERKSPLADGSYVWERKHYTDVHTPDGKYTVVVTVSEAGKTDLCLIVKKDVTIYGVMWEDMYTRPATKDEWR